MDITFYWFSSEDTKKIYNTIKLASVLFLFFISDFKTKIDEIF